MRVRVCACTRVCDWPVEASGSLHVCAGKCPARCTCLFVLPSDLLGSFLSLRVSPRIDQMPAQHL